MAITDEQAVQFYGSKPEHFGPKGEAIAKAIDERRAKVHQPFYTKDSSGMPVHVWPSQYGPEDPLNSSMCIAGEDGEFIYITKQQTKDFFGL